ncbi:MAG: hypothetical protein KGH75_03450 [Rhodospirillales bacterium]|nr:hypothetical protein [Rhodospirillales bacterium]
MSFVTASRNRNFVQTVLAPDTAEIAARDVEIQRRVKQEIAKLRDTAMSEAKEAGEAAARAAMAPQREKLARMLSVMEQGAAQFAAPLALKEQDLAELVFDMALQLARHIAGGESGNARAELAGLVKNLLKEAAAERGPRQTMRLHLHPSDIPALRDQLPGEALALVADESITPGGALLELAAEDGDKLDKTEWDARLESRFTALQARLALPGETAA